MLSPPGAPVVLGGRGGRVLRQGFFARARTPLVLGHQLNSMLPRDQLWLACDIYCPRTRPTVRCLPPGRPRSILLAAATAQERATKFLDADLHRRESGVVAIQDLERLHRGCFSSPVQRDGRGCYSLSLQGLCLKIFPVSAPGPRDVHQMLEGLARELVSLGHIRAHRVWGRRREGLLCLGHPMAVQGYDKPVPFALTHF